MKKEHGSLIWKWFIPFATVVIIILIMFLNFSNNISESAIKTVETQLEEIAYKNAQKVYNDLQCVGVAGETTAQVFGSEEEISPELSQNLLSALREKAGVYEAVYCIKDLFAVNHLGEHIDLKETDYYGAINKKQNVKFLYTENDGITGSDAIVVVIPVPGKESFLLMYYHLDRASRLINMDEFDQYTFAALINNDGKIMISRGAENVMLKDGNIWKNIDKKYQNIIIKAKVKMQNMDTDSVAVAAGEEERTLVYSPLDINDWVMVFGISQSYVDSCKQKIWAKTIGMLYQLLSVMILFIVEFAAVDFMAKRKNEENSKSLQEKADTDLLTGLNNKLATERKIKEYISQNPNSMAMMFVLDIDNFKKINDTMGHAFGDEVLRTLGKQIGSNFRVTDIIGRTGGDEFTIFLKDMPNDEVILKEAQKLATFFKNFQAGDYVKYSATASIGAAVFPADGNNFETLYKSADQALYKAKRRGKNQLAFYDDRERQE